MDNQRYEYIINDLIEHKKYVLESCKRMSKYLFKHGQPQLAKDLLRRAFVHDDSKLDDDEMEKFLELKIKDNPFKNANSLLNDYEKERISVHWKKNRHHPEYFDNVEDMEELDILEMVCDWFARSMQYNTDIIEFAMTRQKNRFKFPDYMFNKILLYCQILKDTQQ